MTDLQDMAPDTESQDRPRPKRRFGVGSALILMLSGVLFALAILIWAGQTLTAPLWLRQDLAERIEKSLGERYQIAFGDIEIVIRKDWRPRVRLRDLVVHDAGQELFRLTDAEASLSATALLRGQVQPSRIRLSGVQARLNRNADGTVSLTLGDQPTPFGEAPGLPQLMAAFDDVLQSPVLSALRGLEMQAMTVQYSDLRAGRIWTIDGGTLAAERSDDTVNVLGSFPLLSGRDYASTVEISYRSRIGEAASSFGFAVEDIAAQDIATQNVALEWLQVLRAPISGALNGSISEGGALGPLEARLEIGPGVLQPTDQTRPIPFESAGTSFTFLPQDSALRFDDITLASPWVSGAANGTAYLGIDPDRGFRDLIGQFNFRDLSINPDQLYADPVQISAAAADFRLELNPFRVSLGQMQIADGDSTLLLSGDFQGAQTGWQLALDGQVDALTPARLVELWPPNAGGKVRAWVDQNFLGGHLHDLNLALRTGPSSAPEIYVDFDYSDATVRFAKALPPVMGAEGQATLVGKRFVTTATSGQVHSEGFGALEVAGTSFIIPDISIKKAAPGVAEVVVEGPIAALLSLLNRPPISVLRHTDLPVDMALGTARVAGTLRLPLKPKTQYEEMTFSFGGTIRDVTSTVIVPDHTLSAAALDVWVDQGQVILSGPGQISGLPVEVSWRQELGPGASKVSQITGQVELSQRAVDTFDLGLPKGSVSGLGQGAFTIELAPDTPPSLALRSDLAGVVLRIPALGWTKGARSTGTLEVDATLAEVPRVDSLNLNAAGLSAQGQITNRPGGGLDRARFSSVRVGRWLNASVDLIGRGRNAAPDLRINGGVLDMRTATFGSSGGQGETGGMDVTLDRLQITETLALSNFQGRFNTVGGLNGAFSGRLNGQTPVTGEMVPQGRRSAFRIKSDNAGGVFRDAGLLTQARGGDFTMTLTPADQPGEYDGSLRVVDTRVKKAPAIAALLNAASIIGLLDELSGAGIVFAEVEARFRLGPGEVTVYKSSAVGPSIGLSMDGRYDISNNRLNMRGVISPIYLINGIGSVLTRKGEGLVGINYALLGKAESPSVQINPLSALTPGMLRDVFRTEPPPVDPTAPKRKPPRNVVPDFDSATSGR